MFLVSQRCSVQIGSNRLSSGGTPADHPTPEDPTINQGNTSSKNTYFPDGYYGRPLATETHRKRLICIFSHIQSQPVCMCMGMVFGPVQNIHLQSLKRTHSLSNIFSGAIFRKIKFRIPILNFALTMWIIRNNSLEQLTENFRKIKKSENNQFPWPILLLN